MTYDIAIIGGGIVGLATALKLSQQFTDKLVVIEAETHLATHQTGHNSGVIHSGLYYKPGSLKAKNCVRGRNELYQFCETHHLPFDRCGKIVVATQDEEIPRLQTLHKRGVMNGLTGLRWLQPDEIAEFEPHAQGLLALHVPETGIVDYQQVSNKYGDLIEASGGQIQLNTRLLACHTGPHEIVLNTTKGEIRCHSLINCCGLQSDRVARLCGADPKLKIIPFRGEYYELIPEKQNLVRNLIYPVPDPEFPFLGVHFTRMIQGGVEAGPNAVFAFKREGYDRFSFSWPDFKESLGYSGFRYVASKYWKMGVGEFYRSLSKRAFVKALQKLLPELEYQDVQRSGAGVRAQAVEPDGSLVDDFRIVQMEKMIHVLNAPSPAATASLSIGQSIAEMAGEQFGLKKKSN